MSKILTPGLKTDFIKELKLLKSEGRMGTGLMVLRNQIWTRIAAAHDARWMLEHRDTLRAEMDAIVEGVNNG